MKTTLTRSFALLLSIVSIFALAGVVAHGQLLSLQIIPAPKQVSAAEAEYLVGREPRIVLADDRSVDDRFAAQDFVDDLKQADGVNLKIGGSSRGEILIGSIDLPKIQQALKRGGLDPRAKK